MILTWNCRFCMLANDNNNGPCNRCGGHTEMKMVNGRWKEVTIKEPNRGDQISKTEGRAP